MLLQAQPTPGVAPAPATASLPAGAPRARLIAALACLVFAGCGGGGGSSAPSGGGGGGGGGAVTPPFLLAEAGGSQSQQSSGNINFVLSTANAVGSPLVAFDPDGGTQTSNIAQENSWLEVARLSQWTASSGNAGAWGTRLLVYATTNGNLELADLAVAAGAPRPASAAAPTALAGGLGTSLVCTDVTQLDDYANAGNSVLVFRNPGPTALQDCGSADDQFYTVALAGGTQPGSSGSQSVRSWVEPVEAVRDASGAIQKLVSIVHASSYTSTGSPSTSPTLQVSAPSLTGAVAISTPNGGGVNGTGTNAGGSRDFQSLGVVTVSGTAWWLYRDLSSIMAASVGASSPSALQALPAGNASVNGVAQAPAWFDATNAYVAVNGAGVGAIVALPLSGLSSSSIQPVVLTNEAGPVKIAGIAGGKVYYWLADGSAVKAVPVAGGSATVLSTGAIVAGTSLASAYTGMSAPVVVSSGSSQGVYFTVCDCTGYSAAPQAWYSTGSGSPVRVGGSGASGVVLGGFVPSATPVSGAATPAYAGAVIATSVSATTSPAGWSFLGAGLAEYGAGGAQTLAYGALGAVAGNSSFSISGGTLASGTAQQGMPYLFLGSGTDSNGNPAQDLWKFTPGSSGIQRVTSRLQ